MPDEESAADAALPEAPPEPSKRELMEAARRAAVSESMVMLRSIPYLEVLIPSAVVVGGHIEYELALSLPQETSGSAPRVHKLRHRYSDFARLHEALVKTWGRRVDLPQLPAKRLLRLSEREVEERRASLEEYVRGVVVVLNWSREESVKAFLEVPSWLRLKPR